MVSNPVNNIASEPADLLLAELQNHKLPAEFYQRPTLEIALELLGKVLVCVRPEGVAAGYIVETEAYIGQDDPACHAYKGLTPRNKTMWGEPGLAYVYFTYGNHWMLNTVTERADYPAAALLRGLQPLLGLDLMHQRRQLDQLKGKPADYKLANGPGKLCQALGITGALNGFSLQSEELFIANPPAEAALPPFEVVQTTRIGITRGMDSPWRYYVAGNKSVSKT